MKRLLLLGAGAAHLQVAHAFAAETLPGVELTLVAPAPRALHGEQRPRARKRALMFPRFRKARISTLFAPNMALRQGA